MTLLQLFVFFALPVSGMCYAILGALKLPLAERLKMDEAKVGGLVASFGLMIGPIILAAGFLSDALGRQWVWVGGSAVVTCSLILLSRVNRYGVAVIAVLMLSGGWAAMINVANPVMFMAFENPLTATNTGDFFFGLGAFLTPPLVAFLLRKIGYTKAVSCLAGLAAFAVAMGFVADLQPAAAIVPEGGEPAPVMGFVELISDPVMWLCALTMMFWAPLESATAVWSTTMVGERIPEGEDKLRSKRIGEWTLSGFWLCFMASRLLMAIYHQLHQSENPILEARITHVVLAVLAIGAMLSLVILKERKPTIITILFAGLLMGPFFPNLVAVLLDHFPDNVSGRAIGIIFAGASIGWTVVPLIIGKVAKRTGSLRRGFTVAVVDAVILLGLVVAHLLYANSQIGS